MAHQGILAVLTQIAAVLEEEAQRQVRQKVSLEP
jgi:hypothetical protein